jgi:ADP-ribose pyrophosphatase YjhB (NUDIX family)
MIEGSIRFCPNCGNPLTEKLHTGKLRPACTFCGWVYFPDPRVAVATLIKKGDCVLLVQRRFDPHKGQWTLPSGFVDAGEDPKLAAERECLEETGLKITNLRLVDVLHSQEHPRGASILILYQGEAEPGEIIAGDDALQAVFFDIHHLPELAFQSTYQIIKEFFGDIW